MSRRRQIRKNGIRARKLHNRRTNVSSFALWRYANGEVLSPNATAHIERQLKNNIHCRAHYRRLREN